MHARVSFPFAIATALTIVTLSGSAWCTETDTVTTTTEPDGYGYKFKDDPLQAGGFGPRDARLHVVPHAARSLLIRPRTQFVAEMLKSVENL
jgi:hypothetical protein